jgi:tRNA modification GTPase
MLADTIYALSTARGVAGVAIIRLSGPAAVSALAAICGPLPKARQLARRSFRHPMTKELIDDGMAVLFPGPHSYTGETIGELHSHGSRAVIAALLAALATIPGLRLAEPGEFTRRAFLNDRIDLTAAEGLSDLLTAETDAQRRLALNMAGGALKDRVEAWRQRLIGAMALVEAMLDFADEGDVEPGVLDTVPPVLHGLTAEITKALAQTGRAEIIRDGFRVVLAGAPNAGKSSLLNALVQRDAAIVSPEAGTTRDIVEARLDLDGLTVIISDTAGLRESAGPVEREGMRRTLAAAETANLIIWLVDQAAPELHPPAAMIEQSVPILTVINKIDLGCAGRPLPGLPPDTLQISARRGTGVAQLLATIAWRARAATGPIDTVMVTRARQCQALEQARSALMVAQANFPHDLELRAEDLRHAAQALSRITGRVDVEDVLDAVFGAFCIGK